ncbi:hypothetical protein DCO58_03045 [Helicobacter saguini]|uniref:Lysozyme inhibitor LprI N-terminal domain-containing protein n=3 Tax=Helicobacter saguini TaxID=1548018 RepID=A0A6L7DB30_9HELI|nr:hypothetical protein [Helicobacter saguini]MWV62649.1 hypothetical protein [Helicobacter saguini]MWV66679.1 hypothetical protein [Helicobacter saguini]MWV69029.1 hypothetical protein [Helicobacter saguini]MWV71417.1 hypothetical protein [Helicobacter saguini]
MKHFIIICLFLNIIYAESIESNVSPKPSFPCIRATTKIEKIICTDESGELQNLDSDMNEVFNIIMGKYDLAYMNKNTQNKIKPYLRILKDSHIEWLNLRNKCASKTNDKEIKICLKESYIKRISSFIAGYDIKEGLLVNLNTHCKDYVDNYSLNGIGIPSAFNLEKDSSIQNELSSKKFYDYIDSTMPRIQSNKITLNKDKMSLLAKNLSNYTPFINQPNKNYQSKISQSDFKDTLNVEYIYNISPVMNRDDLVACNALKRNKGYCVFINADKTKYDDIQKEIAQNALPTINTKDSQELLALSLDTLVFMDEDDIDMRIMSFAPSASMKVGLELGKKEYEEYLIIADKFFFRVYYFTNTIQDNKQVFSSKLICRLPSILDYESIAFEASEDKLEKAWNNNAYIRENASIYFKQFESINHKIKQEYFKNFGLIKK